MKIKNYEIGNKAGFIEYKMSKEMAEGFLADRKNKIPNVNEYLCKIVNEQFGLKGYCINVLLDRD